MRGGSRGDRLPSKDRSNCGYACRRNGQKTRHARPPANCKPVGRWRIVQADIWERDHLDLCRPAMITITGHGRGEIAFGALQAGLDMEYAALRSDSHGKASMKWTKFPATALPKCSMTAPSKSNSPITMATKPSSSPNGRILKQPAKPVPRLTPQSLLG